MTDTEELLLARADELCARAARGEVVWTHFLTPHEEHLVKKHIGNAHDLLSSGGYPEAERRRIFFLPPYLAAPDEDTRAACLAEPFREALSALRIAGSGYRELSHRDFLGAVLHLGVERDRIGDILVPDPHTALLFTDCRMAEFLTENLARVANDAVRITPFVPPPDFDGGKRYQRITDTVASARADAVVAALTNLSRERAQALFREGRVEIDYEAEERPDRQVAQGAVISVRGFGKFTIRSLSDRTRKDRLRLLADRHV